jgi:NAD(P)-dependent dehydrogenase (short-subunit alcohol dehydrogenase family)
MSSAHYADLAGKVVLVTGGATGIGAAHVHAFARNGAKVAFIDRQQEPGRALAAGVPGARFYECDLLDLGGLSSVIERVAADLGPISSLISNAAVDQRDEFADITPDDFDWMMAANLKHVLFAAQQVAPQMRALGAGSIVNTTSTAWMTGLPDLALYSAAKAAIVGLTNSLARRLGPDRIRVNAIAPGYVATPRQRSLWWDPEAEKALLGRQCIPDPVEPGDIANLALFLCSDAARLITRQCLVVNAGLS